MDTTSPPRNIVTSIPGRVTPTTNHSALNNSISPSKEGNISGNSGMTNNLSGGNRSHGYCLKWKYHPNNLLHMFNQLLLNESFTDVVLGCEGKVIKCHKMVLSACSKYFEQVFCEYPQQNSTLVILKDYSYYDVQAIIEFMYQGEINVAHDRLQSLLKAAESLQVKGLADITGGGDGGTAVNSSAGVSRDESEFMPSGNSGDDSNPPSPPGVRLDGNGDAGGSSFPEPPAKRKRGRPPMNAHADGSSLDGLVSSAHHQMIGDENQFDEFPLTNMIETQYTIPRGPKKIRRKILSATTGGSGHLLGDLMDQQDEEAASDDFDDDDVTEEDVHNIVKMTDYIEKGGSRPQFWDEPLTKKVMNSIKNKKMEMKAAAEVLGVSYSTLYSRYRELYGYLKMPANQDTNFNYYQVLNLLRAGQISLQDAAKRLSINERTLTTYLSTTITPKRPKTLKPGGGGGGSNLSVLDSKTFGMLTPHQGASLLDTVNQNAEDLSSANLIDSSVIQNMDEFDDDDSDESVKNLHFVKTEVHDGGWGGGR